VFLIVSRLLNSVVARRIDEENATLEQIVAGNLDARAEAGGTREFESLSEGINVTVKTLKGWISEAETRMDAELATARAIQESALPRTFPPYPDILKFDVYASMSAAKQVGGDFYDFFLVGDDSSAESGKVGFIVADVSGKGVPAALFMMRAKALLHDYVGSGMELGEAVSEANRQLLEGNDEGMFVTAWVGVLDYGTGHVDYVNAGHNPPLLWQRDGGWRWMRKKSGPVLGLFELPYRAHEVECDAGDMFLLYTDGVTEAFDVHEKLYGEDRLLAVAEDGYRLHPRELLEAVRADVAAYAEGAEQSDDITVLALEVGVPPEVTATLDVPADVSKLDDVNEFLHAELDRRLCPSRVQNQLDIAVEELFVNVCHYAYPDATPDQPGNVRIQRTYNADPPSITVDIIDEGVAFDPLAKPDAVTPDNIEDVPIGGLGILMAKKCLDEMSYERVDNANVVTLVKKW
jgi:anti-sigma regulatory factor (Ser/Thr protein kinase)